MATTRTTFSKYQKLLLGRKRELLRQVLDGDASIGTLNGDRPADFLDVAGMTTALELRSVLGQNERKELDEIERAFQKIREKTYGRCETCGEKILPARLEAIPTARLCLDCKSKEESKPLESVILTKARKLAGDAPITIFPDDDGEDKNTSIDVNVGEHPAEDEEGNP